MGKIGKRSPFSGYAKNKQQTEKKKLTDVFVKGDAYFNSGDLLRIDHEGFVFFQDRIGDTFRFVDETRQSSLTNRRRELNLRQFYQAVFVCSFLNKWNKQNKLIRTLSTKHLISLTLGCILNRWKGENVATTEVADHLLMVDCIEEANVYGVKVPGNNYFTFSTLFI